MLLADLTDMYLNFLQNTSLDELHKVFEDIQHVKSKPMSYWDTVIYHYFF